MINQHVFELGDDMPMPVANDDVLSFLASRRSAIAHTLTAPGPNPGTLTELLRLAARAPDHRRVVPFRFVVVEGDAQTRLGQVCLKAALELDSNLSDAQRQLELNRFSRAPTVVIVVYAPVLEHKTPEWEQTLCCGAVCQNLLLATHAAGFGAQWITETLAYEPKLRDTFTLAEHESIAGFIHIGTPTQQPKERPRPEIEALTHRL